MKRRTNLFYAGLELTLACPCRCETCGSAAGRPRNVELGKEQWLEVIDELAILGCRRLTLLGGEPLLFSEWPLLVETAKELGMEVEMVTSGIGLDRHKAGEMARSGLASVTVSVDGTREVHDEQRKLLDAHGSAIRAIEFLSDIGMPVGVNTQINPKSLSTLTLLAPELEKAGARGWQLQLTMPSGNAIGRADLVVDPRMMPRVYQTLKALLRRKGLRPFIADNIGYLTDDDPLLRTPQRMSARCWMGCFAGLRGVGVMSDGSVKGCLALPDSLIEGNIREETLSQIWRDKQRFVYNRAFDSSNLHGACASCTYGNVCRGGCTALAMAVHQRPGISTHCLRLI